MGLRIALGQFNACVGDISGNCEKVKAVYEKAVQAGADLLILPEMFICGYPPEDLLLKKHFLDESLQAVKTIAATCSGISIMVGFAEPGEKCAYNSLAVLQDGKIANIYRKGLLPNYGVFDEKRYFVAGGEPLSIEINGISITTTICEDVWDLDWLGEFIQPLDKNQLIVNISASPFHAGKFVEKQQLLSECATRFSAAVAYCNLVGGQDELVFDGRSMVVDSSGKIAAQAEGFVEDLLIADIETTSDSEINVKYEIALPTDSDDDDIAEIYQAIVLGLSDYVRKNGFKTVIIGLSGGVDSALTAAIAVNALGAENVVGVTMPSKFNSSETITDAEISAKRLGIEFYSIPISKTLDSFGEMLKIRPGWKDEGIAYENLQARIRGTILMSMSNRYGHLVLTTGNKSETSAGYSTLYGDTAGGFAVIKDVPKTMVYELCEYINRLRNEEIVPVSVINRPPSAELRNGQKDSDSLPDYDVLDAILKEYIENEKSASQIIAEGFDSKTVRDIVRLVDRNEYKRRQSPPGVKITPKSLGRDRRMPITNRYVP